MELLRCWRIHVFALCLVVVAELIGIQKFGLIVFLPLFYALVLGGVISYPKFHIMTDDMMEKAGLFMPIAMFFLLVKIGLGIGPNLHMLLNSGWALILQEFGHFFGTLIFGLPMALLLKMGREAVGACYSIDREPNVAMLLKNMVCFLPKAAALWVCTSAVRCLGLYGFRFFPVLLPARGFSIPMPWRWAAVSAVPA